jgi:hypothetical protein
MVAGKKKILVEKAQVTSPSLRTSILQASLSAFPGENKR